MDPFLDQVIRGDSAGSRIVTAYVADGRELLVIVLGDSYDPVLAESVHIISGQELPDDSVRLPIYSELHHLIHTAIVPQGEGHLTYYPRLVLVGETHYPFQKLVSI